MTLIMIIRVLLYNDTPDGIIGNEDEGQMSAWYIMSALGIYQVNPAGGTFVLGSPLVDEAEINFGKKKFRIVVKIPFTHYKFVQGIILNSRRYDKLYIQYSEIYSRR